MDGETKTLSGNQSFDNVEIINGGTLAIEQGEKLILNVNNDFLLDSSSEIEGYGRGYSGGTQTTGADCGLATNEMGGGPGGGTADRNAGEGGGYGGNGGAGVFPDCELSQVYGDKTEATRMGSGGGSEFECSDGGDGGGNLQLYVGDTTTIEGTIDVRGENISTCNGDDTTGAGSGGGVRINTKTLEGSGSILAAGGSIESCFDNGGGAGGGGRIAIYHENRSGWAGSTTVAGGSSDCGGEDGGTGTIYWEHVSQAVDWSAGTFNGTTTDRNANSGVLGIGYPNGSSSVTTDMPGHDSLVGQWRFDRHINGSGGNVIDYSGQGNSGTTQNGVTTGTKGIFDTQAFNFDGSDDLVNISTDNLLNSGQTATFAGWIETESTGTFQPIISALDSNRNTGFVLDISDTDALRFSVLDLSQSDTFVSAQTTDIQPNERYFVAGTYDGTNLQLYVNGELKDSVSASNYGMNTLNDVLLGADIEESTPQFRYFNGTVDELMVFDSALTDTDVEQLYFNGAYQTVEGFEDGDLSEYTADFGSVSDWSIQSNTVYRGDKALSLPSASTERISSNSGLERYPEAGDTFSFKLYLESGTSDNEKRVRFGNQGNGDDGYAVYINTGANNVELYRSGSSITNQELASTNLDWSSYTGEWLDFTIDWRTSGTMQLNVSDSTGTQIASITGSDSTYSSGGIGFLNQDSNQIYLDAYQIESTQPTFEGEYTSNETQPASGDNVQWKDLELDSDINLNTNAHVTVNALDGSSNQVASQQEKLTSPAFLTTIPQWNNGMFNGTSVNRDNNSGILGIGYPNATTATTDLPSTNNIQGQWRFDENYGSSSNGDTATDYSGNNNDGTTQNGVNTTANGLFGTNAYDFDDSNSEHVSLPDLNLNSNDDFSFVTWVNPDVIQDQRVLARFDGSDDLFEIKMGSNGQIIGSIGHFGGSTNTVTSSAIPQNEWTQIAWTYDASATTANLYINGQNVDTSTSTPDDFATGDGPWIGGRNDNALFWDGQIDEVLYYDNPLSQTAIEELYLHGTDGEFQGNYTSKRFGPENGRIDLEKLTINSDTITKQYTQHQQFRSGATVQGLALDPDGEYKAVGEWNGVVYIYDESGNNIDKLTDASDRIYTIAFSPDGSQLITGGEDSTIRVYDTSQLGGQADPAPTATFSDESDDIQDIKFTSDGSHIAAAGASGNVYIYNTDDWELTKTLTNPSSAVQGVSWSSDDRLLAAGSHDNNVYVWNSQDWSLKDTLNDASTNRMEVAFDPQDDYLAVVGNGAQTRIYDVSEFGSSPSPVDTLTDQTAGVIPVTWSNDGSILTIGTDGGTVYAYAKNDIGTGDPAPQQSFSVTSAQLRSLAWGPDDRRLGVGSDGNGAFIYNVTSSTVDATVRVYNETGTEIDSQTERLTNGKETFELGLATGAEADLVIDGTTNDVTQTWTVTNATVDYSETIDLDLPNSPQANVVFNGTSNDPTKTFEIASYSLGYNDPPIITNPSPQDGASAAPNPPTLSVTVDDLDSSPLNVTFYNGNNNVIGTENAVEPGETASIQWKERSPTTSYSWYVVVDDGNLTTQSSTWSFTTEQAIVSRFGNGTFNGTSIDRDDNSGILGIGYPNATTTTTTNIPAKNNLVAQWRLDEDYGTDSINDQVTDYSGHTNHGETRPGNNGAGVNTSVSGTFNTNSYSFPGTSKVYSQSTELQNVHNTGEVTYALWYHYNGSGGTLYRRGTSSSGNGYNGCQYEPTISSNNVALSGCSGTGEVASFTSETGWNFLVASFSETADTATIYLNGQQVAQKSIQTIKSNSNQASYIFNTQLDFSTIGVAYNAGLSDPYWLPYNNRIDEVMIFDQPLNQQEVKQLYFHGQDNIYDGNHTSQVYEPTNKTHTWSKLSVNSSINPGTEANITIDAVANGTLQDSETHRLTAPQKFATQKDWLEGTHIGTTADRGDKPGVLSLGYPNGISSTTTTMPGHDSLIGQWRLDQTVNGDGGTVTDYSGNNNDGKTQNGVITDTTGVFKTNAYNLPGSDESITIPYDSSLDFSGSDVSMTITAWIKPNATTTDQMIFGKYRSSSGQFGPYMLEVESDNELNMQLYEDSSDAQSYQRHRISGINRGEWQFVAASVDLGSGDIVLAIDGTQQTVSTSITDLDSSSLDNRIGSRINVDGTLQGLFNGTIDEVMVFDSALSASDLNDLYLQSQNNIFTGTFTSERFGSPTGNVSFNELTVDSTLTENKTKGYGLQYTLTDATETIQGLSFGPNRKYLAAGSFESNTRIYDLNDGSLIDSLTDESTQILGTAFSSDGQYLAAGGQDATVYIYNYSDLGSNDPAPVQQLTEPTNEIRSVTWNDDNSKLMATSGDSNVYIYNTDDWTLHQTLTAPTDVVQNAQWNSDESLIAATNHDNNVYVWRTSDYKQIDTLTDPTDDAYYIAFSPETANEKYLAVTSRDSNTYIYNETELGSTPSSSPVDTITDGSGDKLRVQFSPDGSILSISEWDTGNAVRHYDVTDISNGDPNPIQTLTDGSGGIRGMDWNDEGTKFAIGSDNGNVYVYNILPSAEVIARTYDSNDNLVDSQSEELTGGKETIPLDLESGTEAEVEVLGSSGSPRHTFEINNLTAHYNDVFSLDLQESSGARLIVNGTSTTAAETFEIDTYSLDFTTTATAGEQTVSEDWRAGIFNGTSIDRDDNSGILGIGYPNATTTTTTNIPNKENLIAQWRFDRSVNGDGGTLKDYSGNNNDGTTRNGIQTGVNGIFNTPAYRFDGKDDIIELGDLPDIQNAYTVSAWIKPSEYADQQNDHIIRGRSSSGGHSTIRMELAPDGKINFWHKGTDSNGDPKTVWVNSTSVMPQNQWTLVTGRWDSANDNLTLLINGQIEDTTTETGYANPGDGWYIGGLINTPSRSDFYNGTIDEVTFYHTALSDTEVKQLYFHGQDNIYDGNYTSKVYNPLNTTNNWKRITVNSTVPQNVKAKLTVNALDANNNTQDSDTHTLTAPTYLTTQNEWNTGSFNGTSADRNSNSGVLGSPSTMPPVPAQESLIGRWKLDQSVNGFGGTVTDYSGNNNDGTTNGGVTTGVQGVFGTQAFQFDGTEPNNVQLPASMTQVKGALTVSAWVYPTAVPGESPQSEGRSVISQLAWDSNLGYQGWHLGADWEQDEFDFIIDNSAEGKSASPGVDNWFSNNLNEWHHMVGVYKPGEYVRLYDNGDLVAETTAGVPDEIPYVQENDHARIGERPNGQSTFHGTIDEPMIYQKALNSEQIQQLYLNSKSGILGIGYPNGSSSATTDMPGHDNLIGQWRLDLLASGNGGIATDYSGNNNDGTTNGGVTITNNGVFNTPAFDFDGNDNYLGVSGGESLVSGKTSLTLSAWVKTRKVSSGYPGIVVAQNPGGNQIGIFQHDGNFYYEVGTDDGSSNVLNPGEPVNMEQWTHVTLVFDGAENTMREYINGEYTGRSMSTATGRTDTGQTDLNIGRWSGGPDYFNGTIDEVMIFDTALNEQKIKQLYFHGTDGTFQGNYTSKRFGPGEGEAEWHDATITNKLDSFERTFTQSQTLTDLSQRSQVVSWSPNSNYLAAGSDDSSIYIYNTTDWTLTQTLTDASDNILGLGWDSSTSRLAATTASSDGTVYIYNTTDWSLETSFTAGTDREFDPDFRSDSSLLAVPSEDTDVRIYNTSTWNVETTLTDATDEVFSTKWSGDDNYLATSSWDGNVYIYNTNDWSLTQTLTDGTSNSRRVRWSPSDTYLAVGNSDNNVYVYETTNWGLETTLTDATNGVWEIVWSADGNSLISASTDGNVYAYNVSDWSLTDTLTDGSDLRSITKNPSSEIIATAGSNSDIYLYNVNDQPEANAIFTAYNTSGNIVDTQQAQLTGGTETIDLTLDNAAEADITINGTTTDPTTTWEVENTTIDYTETFDLSLQDTEQAEVFINGTSTDTEQTFQIEGYDLTYIEQTATVPTVSDQTILLADPWNIKKDSYRAGQTLRAYATVKDSRGRITINDYNATITGPSTTDTITDIAVENFVDNGYNLTFRYRLPDTATPGEWTFTTDVSDNTGKQGSGTTTFTVSEYNNVTTTFSTSETYTNVYSDDTNISQGTYTDLSFPYIVETDTPLITGIINYGSFQQLSYNEDNSQTEFNLTTSFNDNAALIPASDGDLNDLEDLEAATVQQTLLDNFKASILNGIVDQKTVRVQASFRNHPFISLTGFNESLGSGQYELTVRNNGTRNDDLIIDITR